MDGITFDQLQSVFGNVESELKHSSDLLRDIQSVLGQKFKSLDAPFRKIDLIVNYLKQLKEPIDVREISKQSATGKETKQANNDNANKKESTIFDIETTTASKVISGSAKLLPVKVVEDPKQRSDIDIFIPPETRVFIENLLGDNLKLLTEVITHETDRLIKSLSKKEEKKEEKKNWLDKLLAGIMGAGLIGKLLNGLIKPFEWLAGKLFKLVPTLLNGIGKLVIPIIRGLLGAVGPLLAGAGLAIAGIATLLSGLKDSGPYKGLKKLLGKGLLSIGGNIIKKEFNKLSKLAIDSAKNLSKESRKFVFSVLKGVKGVFKYIAEVPGKLFGGITKALKSLFSGGALKEAGEGAAKGAGKGGFKAILGNIGKFLTEKVLKRLPFIGTLIGLGFAFTRLMKGDVIGALLDVASALATSVPVVGTALSIAIDVFSAVRDTQTGGSEKAGAKNMNWIEPIKKWIGERIKYVPVIGPLIDMVNSISDGKWLDALGYLAKAAIPPLGILIDMLDNTETIASAATTAGNWVSDAATWLYNKAKEIPIIGSLMKAGEALASGKWDDVLGYLGEAIEPLQYIGKLIESGAENIAQAVTTGDFSSIKTFFTTIKDSLISAVLNMLPESILGVSIRSRVAKMLGVAGFGEPVDNTTSTSTSSTTINANAARPNTQNQDKESHWYNPFSWKNKTESEIPAADEYSADYSDETLEDSNTTNNTTTAINSSSPTTNIDAAVDLSPSTISQTPTLQLNEANNLPDTNDINDARIEDISGINDSLGKHSDLLKGLIEYQRQTAINTKELIQAIKSQSNNNINVNNINSSIDINTNPVTSSAFRQAILQR
jgi:hypothetical protein